MSDFQLKRNTQPHLEWQAVPAESSDTDKPDGDSDHDETDDTPAHARPVTRSINPSDTKPQGNIAGSVLAGLANGVQTVDVIASFATRGVSEATGPRLNLPLVPMPKFNHHKLLMSKEQANFFARWDLLLALGADARVIMDYFDPIQLDSAGGLEFGMAAAGDLANTLTLINTSRSLITDVNLHTGTPLVTGGYRAVVFIDGAFKLIDSPQVARRQFTIKDYGCTPYAAENGCVDEVIRDAGNDLGSIIDATLEEEENERDDAIPDVDGFTSQVLGINEATVVGATRSLYAISSYEMAKALENPDGSVGPQAVAALAPFAADLIISGVQAQKDGTPLSAAEVLTRTGLFALGTAASMATRDPRIDVANVNNLGYFAWSPSWPVVLGLTNTHSGFFGEGQYDNPNSVFNLTPAIGGGLYAFNSFHAGAEAGYALSLNPKRFESWIPTMLGGAGVAAQWISYSQHPNEKVAGTLALGTGLYAGTELLSFGLSKLIQDQTGLGDPMLWAMRSKPKGKKTVIQFNPNLSVGPDGVYLGASGRW